MEITGHVESTEQHVCDQARAIRKNGWPSEHELEMIKRKIDDEAQNEDSGQENGSHIEIVIKKGTSCSCCDRCPWKCD